jgi:hypothetical protein
MIPHTCSTLTTLLLSASPVYAALWWPHRPALAPTPQDVTPAAVEPAHYIDPPAELLVSRDDDPDRLDALEMALRTAPLRVGGGGGCRARVVAALNTRCAVLDVDEEVVQDGMRARIALADMSLTNERAQLH